MVLISEILTITSLLSIRSWAKAWGSSRAMFKAVGDTGLLEEWLTDATIPLFCGRETKAVEEPTNKDAAVRAAIESFMMNLGWKGISI